MIYIRKSEDRGHVNHGWLDTYHSFSFGDYHDPEFMGFRHLRVINQDRIDKSMGFGTHPHNNMEIITYVTEGALEHKDSMGNGSVMRSGDVQRMSAGSGVTHSEFNHSKEEAASLLQIWIMPDKKNIKPSYEQKNFTDSDKLNNLKLIASNDGSNESVTVNQDIKLFASILEADKEINYNIDKDRNLWLQVISGDLLLNNEIDIKSGDGVAISDLDGISFKAKNKSEFLLFDLA